VFQIQSVNTYLSFKVDHAIIIELKSSDEDFYRHEWSLLELNDVSAWTVLRLMSVLIGLSRIGLLIN